MFSLCLKADWYIEHSSPDSAWPESGEVTFNEYSTRYRAGLDLVLTDITAQIKPGEKVSVWDRLVLY